jgi:exosortase family protein XrtF
MLGLQLEKLKSILADFPPQIKTFLIRSFILFVVWKGLYLLLWSEKRTLDDPLTQMVAKHSVWVLNQITPGNTFTAKPMIAVKNFEGEIQVSRVSRIDRNGKPIMNIADECNGLELFVLYFGFLLAMPAAIKRKIWFGLCGILIIHVVNILRCVGLGLLLMNWDTYFDIAHHYIFKIMVYSTIFILWVVFSKNLSFSTPKNEAV